MGMAFFQNDSQTCGLHFCQELTALLRRQRLQGTNGLEDCHPYGCTMPSRMANRASSTRSWRLSCFIMRYLWLSIVLAERCSCLAICLTLKPFARCRKISTWRSVNDATCEFTF